MNMGKKQLVGLFAVVNVISFFMAANVMADDDSKKANYTQVKVGMFQPTGDMDDANYDNGGDFSVAYGRYLNKYLVLEAGFDAFGSEQNLSGTNDQAGSYTQDNVLVGAAGFITLKGEYSAGPVDLFGGFGGGIYSVTLASEIDSSRLGDLDTDDSDGVFGVHVVAGANYNINERFFVGVEGKYRWTDDVDIRETVASIPVEYTGDLSGYSVTLTGGFRF
ncbi:MAG: porin family protein [Proteobacteria bacterium]|nr:porin family protein [Pseudomonadota bacterium]